MRFSLQTVDTDRFIMARLEGEATQDGLCEYITTLLKPPFVTSRYPLLSDARNLDVRKLSATDIRKVVDLLGARRISIPLNKHAIVVGDPLTFGMARMYEIMSQDIHPQSTHVFYEVDKARSWLDDP